MRDKIVFFIAGGVLVLLTFLIDKTDKTVAQVSNETTTLDTVIIKGRLTIGDKGNQIVLESHKDASYIVLESKGSSVYIRTSPDDSLMHLGKGFDDKDLQGLLLSTGINDMGETRSLIHIRDDKGFKLIPSDGKSVSVKE